VKLVHAALLVGGVFLVALIARVVVGGGDEQSRASAASAPRLLSRVPAVDGSVNGVMLRRAAAIPPEPAAARPRESRKEVAGATPGPIETPPPGVGTGAVPESAPAPTPPPTATAAPSPTPRPGRRPRPTPAPTFDQSGQGDFDLPGEP
jgi:hypothetical protein